MVINEAFDKIVCSTTSKLICIFNLFVANLLSRDLMLLKYNYHVN